MTLMRFSRVRFEEDLSEHEELREPTTEEIRDAILPKM